MRIALHFLLFMFLYVHSIGQITLSVQTTPSTCQNNGSITVNATGGSGSYTYICNSLSQSLNVFSGMSAGTYTVQVSDNMGISNTITAVVGGNYQNPVIASATSPSNGNITVTLQAGTGTAPFQYAYALAGAPLNPSNYQSSNVFNCLAAGNYDVYVLDACNNTTVYHNVAVSMPAFDFNMSCDNSPSGNVNNIVVSGYTTNGNSPYNYSWSSGLTGTLSTSPATTTLSFTLTCSTNTITVTNACNQSKTKTVDCFFQDVVCANFMNGTATTIAYGGVAPYTYSYQNTNTGVWMTNTTGNYTGLMAGPDTVVGSYKFKATDACGRINSNYQACPNNHPSSFMYNFFRWRTDFYFDCNNNIGVHYDTWWPCENKALHYPVTYTCTSCVPQVSFTHTSFLQNIFSNMAPDTTHTFRLTDNCGNQFTVTSPPRYKLSVTTTRACPFSTITATVECGLPTTFVLRNASNVIVASNTTGIFIGLAPVTYTLTATAANGDYILSTPVDLTVPNFTPFQWGVTIASIKINGICKKYWKLKVNQSYVISGGSIYHTTLADYCQPGTYLLHSNVFCRDTTIVLPPFPQTNLTANVTVGCQGNTGTVVLQGGYSYANWLNFGVANNISIANINRDNYQMDANPRTLNSTFGGLLTGSTHTFYQFPDTFNQVRDISFGYHCPIDTLVVTIPSYEPLKTSPIDGAICSNSLTATAGATTTYGVAPFIFQLYNGAGVLLSPLPPTPTSNPTTSFPGLSQGDYNIKVEDACGTIRNTNVKVMPLNFTPTYQRNCNGNLSLFSPNIYGATYNWTRNGNAIATVYAPIVNDISGVYAVDIVAGVCTYSSSVTVPPLTGAILNANAGADATFCSNVTIITTENLGANPIPTGATGYWTQLSGPPCIFANSLQPNTSVTVSITPAIYKYVWTLVGGVGGCIDKDTVKVTFSNIICPPLSPNLVGFKGIAQEKGNLLSWETTNENNNKGFYLQRSYDLLEWETLPALIKGKNQEINGYDTLDADFNRQMNKVYYRLLQEDTDGNITYSDYISLLSIASNNILIYPNPASNTIFIENAMQEVLDEIWIYNEIGEEVINYENVTGSNKISLSIKDLTAGIYFMKISINGKSSLHKFVKED